MVRTQTWFRIRNSFWFLPVIYMIIAVALVSVIHSMDVWLTATLHSDMLSRLSTEQNVAKQLYATLVTAILTMTTLSFSVIMVVLTTYASQFSPRALKNFMTNPYTRHVLGIYSLGFIFALLLLYLVDHANNIIAPLAMVIIAILTLGAFIYFIHNSTQFLQVNNLIESLKEEGSSVIKHVYKAPKIYGEYANWDDHELKKIRTRRKKVIKAKSSGYIQNIHWDSIINWAFQNDAIIELHVQPGSFIPAQLPIFTIWSNEDLKPGRGSFFIIGKERSDIQDIEFILQKIDEIALRAVSESTTDPHTAINCINRIGVLLTELGEHLTYTPYLTDKHNHLRLIYEPKRFEDFLYKAFYQLRFYGREDISVNYAMMDTLYKMIQVSRPDIKEKVWNFHFYLVEAIEWDKLSKLDYAHLLEIYEKFHVYCKDEGFTVPEYAKS